MAYRRNRYRPVEYPRRSIESDYIPSPMGQLVDPAPLEMLDEIRELPTPSEREFISEEKRENPEKRGLLSLLGLNGSGGLASLFDNLKSRITIEEIILIGLILLLLQEGVEDNLVILMLAFILLT